MYMNWIIFAILSGLFFALARVVARVILKKQANPLAYTAIHDFIAGLILLPLLFFGFHFPEKSITWLYFFGIILFAFVSDWLSFLALKKINVSVYQIAMQIRHIFVLFGGFLFFSEQLNLSKIIGVVVIILGVLIMLYEKGKIHWSGGVLLTFLSTFFAFIAFLFVKFTILDFSETAAASFELISIGFLAFSFLGFSVKKIKKEIQLNKIGIIISGVLFGFFELFLFLALKTGEISKVIPVTQISLVFGVLIGIFYLKEKERLFQKLVGMLIIIVGIILVNLF